MKELTSLGRRLYGEVVNAFNLRLLSGQRGALIIDSCASNATE